MVKERVSIIRVEEQNTYPVLQGAVDLIGGLADLFSGQHKPYIVLAEEVAQSAASQLDLDRVEMGYAC